MTTTTATFAALLTTLYAAHTLADHVMGQTDTQAAGKAGPGLAGWYALARHLAAYHAVVAVMVAIAWIALDLPLTATGAAAGLVVSIATHGLWDRRRPVAWLLTRTGGEAFADLALADDHGQIRWRPGLYAADQALHTACLWAAALITVAL